MDELFASIPALPLVSSNPSTVSSNSVNNGDLKKTFFKLPIQVNYVADVYPGVPYTHKDYSTIDVRKRDILLSSTKANDITPSCHQPNRLNYNQNKSKPNPTHQAHSPTQVSALLF